MQCDVHDVAMIYYLCGEVGYWKEGVASLACMSHANEGLDQVIRTQFRSVNVRRVKQYQEHPIVTASNCMTEAPSLGN